MSQTQHSSGQTAHTNNTNGAQTVSTTEANAMAARACFQSTPVRAMTLRHLVPATLQPASPHVVCVLRAPKRLLTKPLKLQNKELIKAGEPQRTSWFDPQWVEVRTLDDLHRLHQTLTSKPDTFLIRDWPCAQVFKDPIAAQEQELAKYFHGRYMWRRNSTVFETRPLAVVWFDIEGERVDLSRYGQSLAQAWEAAYRHEIAEWTQQLAEAVRDDLFKNTALEGVACIASLTASHGRYPTARLRLGFILSDAMDNAQWLRWLKSKNLLIEQGGAIDPALFQPVQPHYTAAPVFKDGSPDPFKAGRVVKVEGATQTVNVSALDIPPAPPTPPVQTPTAIPPCPCETTSGPPLGGEVACCGVTDAAESCALTWGGTYFLAPALPNPLYQRQASTRRAPFPQKERGSRDLIT
jgi:hypothetical protein